MKTLIAAIAIGALIGAAGTNGASASGEGVAAKIPAPSASTHRM